MALISIEDLPPGSTVTVYRRTTDGKWPGRPTLRDDIHVIWKGPDPDPRVSPSGSKFGMRDNVDTRMVTQ